MNPLQQAICFAIETGLNQLVPYDPGFETKWQTLEGKTVAVNITDWQSQFCVHYQNQVFSVSADSELATDVTLTANSWDFFKVALESHSNEAAAMNSNIHFEGQVSVGQTFANCLQTIDIDWEELLAQPFGDVMARRASNLVRSAGEFFDAFLTTSQRNFTEYMQEEIQLTPTPIEVENFLSDLRQIRTDIDRLSARVQQLKMAQDN
jgi:ubiquinone biosynthesis protein UbiJ